MKRKDNVTMDHEDPDLPLEPSMFKKIYDLYVFVRRGVLFPLAGICFIIFIIVAVVYSMSFELNKPLEEKAPNPIANEQFETFVQKVSMLCGEFDGKSQKRERTQISGRWIELSKIISLDGAMATNKSVRFFEGEHPEARVNVTIGESEIYAVVSEARFPKLFEKLDYVFTDQPLDGCVVIVVDKFVPRDSAGWFMPNPCFPAYDVRIKDIAVCKKGK